MPKQDGEVVAVPVTDDNVDGPQAPPYCRFFTIALVLTLVLVVWPIVVQLWWMYTHSSQRLTYHPWLWVQSENFPWCMIVGAVSNFVFLLIGVHSFSRKDKSQFVIQTFKFLTSKRFKLGFIDGESRNGRVMLGSVVLFALIMFPIVVFWPVLNMAAHSNFLFFRCKDLCWHMSEHDEHTGLDFAANDEHGDFKVTWDGGKDDNGWDAGRSFTVHDPYVPQNKTMRSKKSYWGFQTACAKYINFDKQHHNWVIWKKEAEHTVTGGKFIPDRKESFGTKEETQHVLNQCYDIMSQKMTKVAEKLVRHNYRVLAFNAAMRTYYVISASESFFETLIGAFICMLLVAAYISMKRQETEVRVRMLRLFRTLNRRDNVDSGNGFIMLRQPDPSPTNIFGTYLDEFYDTVLFVEELEKALSDETWDDYIKTGNAYSAKKDWALLSSERAKAARNKAAAKVKSEDHIEHRSFTSAVLSQVLNVVENEDERSRMLQDERSRMLQDDRSRMLHGIQKLLAARDLETAEKDHEEEVKKAGEKDKMGWEQIRSKLPRRKYLIAVTTEQPFVVLGLFGWLGHALMGCVVRRIQNKDVAMTPGFAPSLIGSLLFGFVVNMVLWLALGRCTDGLESCLKTIKAFDATFHFPGDGALSRLESLGDVESREGLIEKFRVDFAKTGDDLMRELPQLTMWGDIRMMLQISQNVEKVDMELHLIIVLFALLCRVAIVVGNYMVMEKDGNRKFQIVNFVVMYDLILIFIVLFKCIFLCKDVNDAFSNQTVNLAKLQRHVSLETNRLPRRPVDEPTDDSGARQTSAECAETLRASQVAFGQTKSEGAETLRASQVKLADDRRRAVALAEDRRQQADLFVQAFLNNVEATDSPMRMFGFVINRYTVAAGVTTALGLLVPTVLPMLYMVVHKAHVV